MNPSRDAKLNFLTAMLGLLAPILSALLPVIVSQATAAPPRPVVIVQQVQVRPVQARISQFRPLQQLLGR